MTTYAFPCSIGDWVKYKDVHGDEHISEVTVLSIYGTKHYFSTNLHTNIAFENAITFRSEK